jgi:hypothetical protein
VARFTAVAVDLNISDRATSSIRTSRICFFGEPKRLSSEVDDLDAALEGMSAVGFAIEYGPADEPGKSAGLRSRPIREASQYPRARMSATRRHLYDKNRWPQAGIAPAPQRWFDVERVSRPRRPSP